jgi:hypothetical protein
LAFPRARDLDPQNIGKGCHHLVASLAAHCTVSGWRCGHTHEYGLVSANGALMLSGMITYGLNSGVAHAPSALACMTFFFIILSLLATLAGAARGRRRAAAHVTCDRLVLLCRFAGGHT